MAFSEKEVFWVTNILCAEFNGQCKVRMVPAIRYSGHHYNVVIDDAPMPIRAAIRRRAEQAAGRPLVLGEVKFFPRPPVKKNG